MEKTFVKNRKFRYIEKGHSIDSLTKHEIRELERDFDIDTDNFFVLVPLTKDEWSWLLNEI